MITRLVTTTANKLILRSRPVAEPATDTGKRLVAGQVAMSFGEAWDKDWQYVAAPSGSGWVASDYLAPASATPSAPTVTETITALRKLFSLAGEDPAMTEAIEKLRDVTLSEGIEFDTADFGGVRTEADTVRILKYRDDDYAVYVRNLKRTQPNKAPTPMKTWRPINPFGTSFHNFGAARDLKITKRPSSFSDGAAMGRLGTLAPSCGLRWGGMFTRVDTPHMELAITLAEAKRRYKARNAA